MIALLLLALAIAANAAQKVINPVVQTMTAYGPGLCTAPCVNITEGRIGVDCMQCIMGTYQVGHWPDDFNDTPVGQLSRMPFPENGLPNIPAIIPFFPPLSYLGKILQTTQESREAYSYFPQDPVEVCWEAGETPDGQAGCATRKFGPDKTIPPENPFDPLSTYCIQQENDAWPWIHLDNRCGDLNTLDPLQNITWNSIEQMVSMLPSQQPGRIGSMQDYKATNLADAEAALTTVDGAADSIWKMVNVGWAHSFHFAALSSADRASLVEMFGSEWTSEMDTKMNEGKMAKLDYTYLARTDYGQDYAASSDYGKVFQPMPFGVFERVTVDGKPVLRCRMLKLIDPRSKPTGDKEAIYTPAKSASAFIAAMIYFRGAQSFHRIWVTHNFHFHGQLSPVAYALLNNVDPGVPIGKSSHPIRMILDAHVNPVVSQNIAMNYWNGLVRPPAYTAIANEYHPAVWQAYSDDFFPSTFGEGNNGTFYNYGPVQMMEMSGLKAEDYTSKGGEPWDLFPGYHISLKFIKLAEDYASKVLDIYYPSGTDLKNDKKVQMFYECAVSPTCANMGQVSPKNTFSNKKDMVQFLGRVLSLVTQHNLPRLLDYTSIFFNLAAYPTRVDAVDLPSPTGTFTTKQLLKLHPNMRNSANSLNIAMLVGPVKAPVFQWMEEDPNDPALPDWTSNLPFFGSSKADKANKHQIQWRKDLFDLMMFYPVDGMVRPLSTTPDMSKVDWKMYSAYTDY